MSTLVKFIRGLLVGVFAEPTLPLHTLKFEVANTDDFSPLYLRPNLNFF